MTYHTEPSFTHGTPEKTGILLVNLGTPDAPTAQAVRPYLKEFLSDPRVVEIPKAIWWFILNGVILNVRPKISAAKYASIWMKEGSPLRVYTEKQATLLQGYLGERTKAPFQVEYAMRYGNPSIASVLQKMKAQNCTRILVVPMYRNMRPVPRPPSPTSCSANCNRCATHPPSAPSNISMMTLATSKRWRRASMTTG